MSIDTPEIVAADAGAGAGALAALAAAAVVGTGADAGVLASAGVPDAAGALCCMAPLAEVTLLAADSADAPSTGADAGVPSVALASPGAKAEAEAETADEALPAWLAGTGPEAGAEACCAAELAVVAAAAAEAAAEAAPLSKSTAGTFNTDPSFNRLGSCPMNAPGLASNSARDIFPRTAGSCEPVISPEISLRDCPGFTEYCVTAAAEAETAAEAAEAAEAPDASTALACAWTSKGSDPNTIPAMLATISAARRTRLDGQNLATGRLARTIIEAPDEWTSNVEKQNEKPVGKQKAPRWARRFWNCRAP